MKTLLNSGYEQTWLSFIVTLTLIGWLAKWSQAWMGQIDCQFYNCSMTLATSELFISLISSFTIYVLPLWIVIILLKVTRV